MDADSTTGPASVDAYEAERGTRSVRAVIVGALAMLVVIGFAVAIPQLTGDSVTTRYAGPPSPTPTPSFATDNSHN
jgi:hypothetical protein